MPPQTAEEIVISSNPNEADIEIVRVALTSSPSAWIKTRAVVGEDCLILHVSRHFPDVEVMLARFVLRFFPATIITGPWRGSAHPTLDAITVDKSIYHGYDSILDFLKQSAEKTTEVRA